MVLYHGIAPPFEISGSAPAKMYMYINMYRVITYNLCKQN